MALFSPLIRGFLSLAFLVALCLTNDGWVAAQVPDPNLAPPPNPNYGTNPGAPNAGAPSGFSNFQNTPVSSILDFYEGLSGKHLIRDVNLNGAPAISINGTGLSKAEMLKEIEQTLLLDGVALVPIDDTTLKVLSVAAKNPATEGAKLYVNESDFPANDQVISYYMPLNYISPQEALGVFQGNVPPQSHPYGTYVAAPSAQAVVITENVSVIRKLIELKELIDVPPAHVATEFVQLNRADADKVAELLNKMLEQPDAGGGAPGAPAPPPQPGGGGDGAAVPTNLGAGAPLENEHNLISGTAKIFSVPRSNQLIIITRPVNLPFLKQLIAQLDQEDIYIVPQRRPLKYVLAEDILPALEIALAVGKDQLDQAKSDTKGSSSSGNTTSSNNNNQTQTSTSGNGSSSGVSAVTSPLEAPKENNAPTVVSIGNTRLLADNRSNSIIVFGSPDVAARVFGMIDELDRKPLQVYLATVIGQLTLTNDTEFGVDLFQHYTPLGNNGSGIGFSSVNRSDTTSASAVPGPSTLTSASVFPLLSGLTLYGTIAGTLDYYVKALETTDRFKVISRPSVYTTNNKLAVIASGSQIPVPSNITSAYGSGSTVDTNNLQTTASVSYQNVLLQLDIIPLINADHEVTLKIRQTNNTEGGNNVISGNNVPTILTQEINTEVTVRDKQTVVIGGLISDNTDRSTSGVPYISDIPVLGYLFKDTKKSKTRSELIIMIQPSVVETDIDELHVNEAEKQRTILGQDAQTAASGSGGFSDAPGRSLLPQLHTTVTSTSTASNGSYNSKTGATTRIVTSTSTTVAVPPAPSVAAPAVTAHPDVSKGQLPKDPPPAVLP